MERLNIQKSIDNTNKQIKNPEFKNEVIEYLNIRNTIDKVAIRTQRNDSQALLILDKYFTKEKIDYKKVTIDQMLKWEKFLQNDQKYSDVTVSLYEIHVKRFYKYLFDKKNYKKGKRFQKNIQYPECVSWISSLKQNGMTIPVDKLLDHDGLIRMLESCDNIRDQTMIISFLDAGLRNSELLSLNIENLGFDKLGAYFILPRDKKADLKTGQRVIRLFLIPSSSKYLKDFVNQHPFKKYGKAPLFYSRDVHFYPKAIRKANTEKLTDKDFEALRLHRLSIKDIIKKIGNRANVPISKPHDLRHNSCTMCVKAGFNEMELRIRYGWSPTSKMPSRYTHLASKDLDDKIKIITGFKEPEEPEKRKLITIVCWNCQEENVPTNKFCSRCGTNLSPKKKELMPTATETGISTQKLLDDPDILKQMINMLSDKLEKKTKEK